MWLYLIIFFIPVCAYMAGNAENRNKAFLICYMGALALFVGFGDMLGGYDRYIYGDIFEGIANGVSNGFTAKNAYTLTYFEPGYTALNYAIACITANRYIYILIVTLLIYFCMYRAFAKNLPNYPLAMILFLGMVFFFSFTYLRQVLAFSVAWLGVTYLIDNKRWKFFLVIALVAILHKSGIVFAILYFLPKKKLKPGLLVAIMLMCAVIGLSGVTGALYDAFANVSYDVNMGNYNTDTGARVAYLLEVVFFVWIILANYRKIEPTRRNIIFLNMAWCFCAILLLFIRSSDGGRVAWFFTIGIIYTVSLICTTDNFHAKVKNGFGMLIIAVMLALYLRVYNSWQVYNNLYPYKTFLTDGHRYPDYSWQRFEYDHRYDKDKFHKPAFRLPK